MHWHVAGTLCNQQQTIPAFAEIKLGSLMQTSTTTQLLAQKAKLMYKIVVVVVVVVPKKRCAFPVTSFQEECLSNQQVNDKSNNVQKAWPFILQKELVRFRQHGQGT